MRVRLLLLGLFIIVSNVLVAQQQSNWMLDKSYNGLKWTKFIEKAEKKFGVNFYYSPEDFRSPRLQSIKSNMPLLSYLESNFSKTDVKITADKYGNIFLYKGTAMQTSLNKDIYQKPVSASENDAIAGGNERGEFLTTSREHLSQAIIIGNKKDGLNKKKVTFRGKILDAQTREPLYGASIAVKGSVIGTTADEKGVFRLKLDKGKHILLINEINHSGQQVTIDLLSSGRHNFLLTSKSVDLDAVTITADTYNKVKNTKMGFERLTTKSIKEIPLVMGERDIMKVATLLAGVQSVGEGTSGFNVRGSPVDQNLFYIDGIPIYNTSHLFGFFSVFNSETISEFSLYKGNVPAKFGGRLASIFDIEAKEGNKEQFKIRGGISPITGRVMLEGPIKKGESSYMIGLRSTYSDWVLRLIDKPDFKNSSADFADAVAKFSFQLDSKNKVRALGYYSFDKINFAKRAIYDIRNEGISLSWNHFFNTKNNFNFSLVYSKNSLDSQNNELLSEAYKQNNVLQHKEAKLNFTFRPNHKHQINMGTNAILYQNDRGKFLPIGEISQISARNLGEEKGIESGVFISEEWKPNAHLTFIAGLRYNLFSYLGPKSVFEYQEGAEIEASSIKDTLQFGNNEPIKTYTGLDYRLGVKYAFNDKISIKASYNRLHQYMFLLSNTIALSPSDNWKLVDNNIRPMQGDQFSLGVYTNLFYKKLEVSVESYYKKANNLVEFKDGADLLATVNPEWTVLQGNLDIYGIEFTVKKPAGRFNGWINYTYSRAEVLVNSPIKGNQINFGNPYPANQDKPHSLNIVVNYKVIRRLSLSANVVYSTGKPITYPTTFYTQNGIRLVNYTERNAYRVPDYFRVDASVKIEGNLKAKKILHGTWVFSIYNLLGRNNTYNVYFKANALKIQGYNVSIFADPIFSVAYNFKFGNYDY